MKCVQWSVCARVALRKTVKWETGKKTWIIEFGFQLMCVPIGWQEREGTGVGAVIFDTCATMCFMWYQFYVIFSGWYWNVCMHLANWQSRSSGRHHIIALWARHQCVALNDTYSSASRHFITFSDIFLLRIYVFRHFTFGHTIFCSVKIVHRISSHH